MVARQHLSDVRLVANDCRAAVDHVGLSPAAPNRARAGHWRALYPQTARLAATPLSRIGTRARLVFVGAVFPPCRCVPEMARSAALVRHRRTAAAGIGCGRALDDHP